MFSWPYISIPYLSPLLVVRFFVRSPTYLYFNIADHQACGPLGGLWHIFLQDIHVLALHGPNGWKIIIVQIIAKNWKGFWHGQVLLIQITLGHFFFMGNLVAHDVMASLIYLCFIYTLFFFKSKRYMCLCNVGKCSRFRRRVKPSLAWFSWDDILYNSSISHKFD